MARMPRHQAFGAWFVAVLLVAISSLSLLSIAASTKSRLATECNVCMDIIGDIDNVLENNATYEQLLQFIQDDVCTILPPADQPECKLIAADIIQFLETEGIWALKGFSPYALCSMISICDVYCCLLPYRPEQVHIAVTGDPTQMAVSWVAGFASSNPQVQYGTTPNQFDLVAKANVTTYKIGGWHGYIYHAVLNGLAPSTMYYYRVGDPQWDWSFHPFSFKSAPAVSATGSGNYTMLVFGDMDVSDVSDLNLLHMVEKVQSGKIDLVLHAGDISYANGFQAAWDEYFRKIELMAAYAPYMASVGNHEVEYNFTAYHKRFRMPWLESTGSDENLYFSFNFGNIHFVSYSLEREFGLAPDVKKGGAQYQWLEADLAQANTERAQRPWIVMIGHRPFYCSNAEALPCKIEAALYRDRLEDMIQKYNVDLVITAHLHSYERTYPVYKHIPHTGLKNPKAPIYTVVGTGANREGVSSFLEHKPSWSAARFAEWGYSLLSTTGNNTLSWQFIAEDGHTLLDQFTVTRTQASKPVRYAID